ncbi:MAG TPA: hypothetical protein VH413_01950 [Verrucomicrobiae bacterium]|jgi:hypothetical protein|nr:hypothetical protein [Verrucomicrobiae bacterium]
MKVLTIEVEALPVTKPRIRWQKWLVIFGIGLFGGLIGWNESARRYPKDSLADVQAVELAVDDLLDTATADKMPQIIPRDEFAAAAKDFSQAMLKLQDYASNLRAEKEGGAWSPVAAGAMPLDPNYDSAWDRFLTAFGRLHARDNRLKATVLYYAAVSWYPRPSTDDHDWRKLNERIAWQLREGDTPERIGYAIGYGVMLVVFAWLVVAFTRLIWNFMLARTRDVSRALRGL